MRCACVQNHSAAATVASLRRRVVARSSHARALVLTQTGCDAYVLEEEECPATFLFYVSALNESVGNRSKSDEGDTSKCHEERSSVVRERRRCVVVGPAEGPPPGIICNMRE